MNSHFDPFVEQAPKKSWFLSEPQLRFLTALISLAIVLIGVFGHQPKNVLILLLLIPAILLAATLLPGLFSLIRTAYNSFRTKRYIRAEYPRLERLYEKLLQFTDQSDGRSLRYILRNLSVSHNEPIYHLVSIDYIRSWIECYGAGLELAKPASLLTFLQKCNELTAIIGEYNRNYVLNAQKIFETAPPNPAHILNDLEKFREEFAHYLREVEEWATSIKNGALRIEPNLYRLGRVIPCNSFEKANTFTKAKPAIS